MNITRLVDASVPTGTNSSNFLHFHVYTFTAISPKPVKISKDTFPLPYLWCIIRYYKTITEDSQFCGNSQFPSTVITIAQRSYEQA